ncbi:pyridoxal phosphate-dependent transferase [Lyophyllum atratum]|nr:pyridoxal phosphate-dependent transferase [Lyophyllum atratum]
MSESRIANFGAGPSALPESVLAEAAKGLLNFNGSGIGIAEISHRSKEFGAYIAETATQIREQLDVPSTHEILFMQGGGTGQFSAVVLNLLARHRLLHPDVPEQERVLDYVLTGSWSKAAYTEATRLANGATVRIAADARAHSTDGKSFDGLPPHSAYAFSPDPALIYYCENETVSGTQFAGTEGTPSSFPLLLLLHEPPDPSPGGPRDHLCRGAEEPRPAGVTILIVRKDCIVDVDAAAKLGGAPVPISLAYKSYADNDSMPNTPSVLAIYVSGLVLQRNKELGGLRYYEELNRRKKGKVYGVLKEGEARGVLKSKVRGDSGSWMNIVFGVLGEGAEARFLAGAEKRGMKGLKGHRSVGGIRVSLYNAVTEEWTDQLVAYIREFIAEESATPATAPVSEA